MKKTLLLLCLYFVSPPIFAQDTIIFGNQSDIMNIGRQVYLLEDKEGKLSFEDIQKPEYQKQFRKSEKETPNYNTTRSTVWVKLTVANQTDERVYLEVAQALAWYIDFYKPDAGGKLALTTQTGMMRPITNREVDNNFFLFELPPNPQAQTYYFSIKSDFVLTIPLSLASKSAYLGKSNFFNLFFGGFAGLLLIMFFYNLFLYISVRDTLYLYYCAYILMSLLTLPYISGNFGYELQPNTYFTRYFIVTSAVTATSAAIFIILLLALPKKTSLYRVLAFWVVFSWILAGINLFTGRYVDLLDIMQGSIFLAFVYVLAYSIMLYRKGHQSARFVVFGFSFYIAGIIIYILQNFGLLAINFFTFNSVIFGTSIEVVLFSLALGERINLMRKEKEAAQERLFHKTKENEKILAEQNEVLAEKVAEKTLGLQTAFEEIQAINEELNQTQEEILSQRDLLETKNSLLEQYTHKIGSSILAAKRLQKAVLPPKDKMNALFGEHFILNRPKDTVSGDFWWANEIEGKKYLILADCTGHGVPGAMLTMIGSALLDQIIRISGTRNPAEILTKLHEEIASVLQQEQTNSNEGMDIAVAHWHYENDGCHISFAAAKRPLLYAHQGQIEKIGGSRRNVGGKLYTMTHFENHTLTLPKGACLYFSSDGFADQNDARRNNFSERRLADFLNQNQSFPMGEQKELLKARLAQQMEDTEQRDDILVIGVRL